MSEHNRQPDAVPDTADFDALYRGDYDTFNRTAQAQAAGIELDRVPWDIGEPQPVLIDLEAADQIHSEVLDIGCGPGDNALFLAERGYHVFGLDGASAAIETARERARQRNLHDTVEFAIVDATTLTGYHNRFATVVDSALYHCLTERERSDYAAALHRACQPGARLHLICFSDAVPESFPGPYRISEDNLRDTLTPAGWAIQQLEHATYTTTFTRPSLIHQAPQPMIADLDAAGIGYDHHQRLLVPVWHATAERR